MENLSPDTSGHETQAVRASLTEFDLNDLIMSADIENMSPEDQTSLFRQTLNLEGLCVSKIPMLDSLCQAIVRTGKREIVERFLLQAQEAKLAYEEEQGANRPRSGDYNGFVIDPTPLVGQYFTQEKLVNFD